jgi:hypothetical protein
MADDDGAEQKADKRPYLEVNAADKYKSFLVRPLETKRLKMSDALEKVKQFLPALKESTDKLLLDNKDDMARINIENVENSEKIIEMNVAFVSDGEDTLSDEEARVDTTDESASESDEDEHSHDDDETDESDRADFLENYVNSQILNGHCSNDNVQITTNLTASKRTKKPKIHVIDDDGPGDTHSQSTSQ